jgi:hypothetical protein
MDNWEDKIVKAKQRFNRITTPYAADNGVDERLYLHKLWESQGYVFLGNFVFLPHLQDTPGTISYLQRLQRNNIDYKIGQIAIGLNKQVLKEAICIYVLSRDLILAEQLVIVEQLTNTNWIGIYRGPRY